ncbi:MAG: hypothetical protein WD826_03965, partial [Actinomycetota bacterium]
MPRKAKPRPSAGPTVEDIEATRDRLRAEARIRLGVTGSDETPPPLLPVLRGHGVTLYPLFALGVLSIVDSFQGYAFRVLAPEISATLGVSKSAIAGALALATIAGVVGPLPIAAIAAQRARRAFLIIVTAVGWSLVAATTGFVTALSGLLLVLVLDGLTTASVSALHTPMLL